MRQSEAVPLRSLPIRVLSDADLPAAHRLLGRHLLEGLFVASRIDAVGLDSRRLGAEIWGFGRGGDLSALCYSGVNLWPVGADQDAARAFVDKARRSARRCSSIVGAAPAVLQMWQLLAPAWGPAREVREDQPLLAVARDPDVASDPAVRRVRSEELDILLPASVSMFTEEVGISPIGPDGGALYRARVAELVRQGRSFARIEGGRVLFKAEVGAATAAGCQVQGVWVAPELRGQGRGAAGMAAVVRVARASIAPVVSLYVNAFNVPARRMYDRVGFERVGTFASVLF
jgi:uncharacterized protein